MLKTILEYILILDLSYFLNLGIYHKTAVKFSLAIGITAYIMLRGIVSRKRFFADFFSDTFLNRPIFIFLGVTLISVLLSPNFNVSQDIFFQRYIYYFLFFFFAAYLAKNKKYFFILLFVFLISAFIVSLGGVQDILKIGLRKAYDNLPSQVTRLYTSFRMPAFFAGYFLYTIPIFLIILLLHPKLKVKLLAATALFPLFICLFFHYSRSTWIVLALSVFIYFIFLNGHKWMGIFVAYFILSVIFIVPPFRERLFSPGTVTPTSWGDRVPMWDSAFSIFKKFPFFGVGPGNYATYMYKVVPENLYKEGLHHLHAHDTFLEILAETGLFGLLSFLFIFFTFFKYMIKRIKKREDYIDIAFSVMVIAVLLGELTASTIMVGVYNACLFWFLMGLAVGKQDDKENA